MLRRRAEPSPELAAALADLDRLARERPELAAPARTLGRLLAAAFVGAVPARLAAKVEPEAVPTFRVIRPEFNPDDLRRRALAVCDALRPDNPAAADLHRALRTNALDVRRWAECPLDEEHAGASPPPLAESVRRLVLLPALAPVTYAVQFRKRDHSYMGYDCPHCGAPALLAEARGLEQRRHLRCGLCAADWPVARLACPACGGDDPRGLEVRYAEGEQDRYRLLNCRSCGLRLKIVATLAALTAPALLVADLASVHLDFVI